MNRVALCVLLTGSGLAAAGEMPDSAFHIGLGGSASSVNFNAPSVSALGISDVYNTSSGQLISSGSAGGPPVNADLDSANKLAPSVQAGYFSKFAGSTYLWGAKFAYTYVDASSSSQAFLVPQYGSFGATPFTGNALIRSYQTSLRQQVNFLPYLGKAFADGYAYIGAGPTYSKINTKANGVIGFADINGQRSDISGAPQSFSANNWVWGWQASLGGSYFIDKEWFVDVNYTYGVTNGYSADLSGPFTNVSAASGRTYTGSLIGSGASHLTTNAVAFSINRAF